MLYNPTVEKQTNKECKLNWGGVEDEWPPSARHSKETQPLVQQAQQRVQQAQQLIQKAQRLILSAERHIRESQRMIHEEGDPLNILQLMPGAVATLQDIWGE